MKYIIDKDLVEQVKAITGHNYGAIDGVIITSDAIEFMIEELIHRYKELEDKFIEYDKEVNEFYKPKHSDPYDFYGVSPQDF